MLASAPGTNRRLERVERTEGGLCLHLGEGMQLVEPIGERAIRVRYTEKTEFSTMEKPGIVAPSAFEDWDWMESDNCVTIKTKSICLKVDKATNCYRYYDRNGAVLLQEREERSKELEEIPVYQLSGQDIQKEFIDTPDGRKELVRDASRIQRATAYHTRIHFDWEEDEALYGLGQQEEGYTTLRGNRVYLHQANRKIAIPVLVSVKGYGLLINTYSPAIFNDTPEGAYFYTECDPEMDFYFLYGGDMDGVIREYRKLTGKAALLPKWAFGYIQSQERYETARELKEIAKAYREKGIGLDCVVLDWCSWPDGQWGQKSFDEKRFPDPDGMTRELHENHVHFMLSIWPNLDHNTDNYKEFKQAGLLLPGCNVYNALSEQGRRMYWQQAREGLYRHGVDAWWCDNSEPFTPEWNHMGRGESSKQYEEYCKVTADHLPLEYSNAYGLYHAMAIYEGQRGENPSGTVEKRVVNLTRCGYLGQQRYGTILWSGDIAANWDTLRRQIAAGLQFCASGLPYWTVDIGAFFVKYGRQWFWNGDYDGGYEDLGYCELFVRWFQWGAFLPVFRGHGTEIRRELWNFDHPQAPFYQALLKANRVRYQLMPYLYSLAGMTWLKDGLMMKPLAFGFAGDKRVWKIMDQYLLGDALMICPVTKPMYYDKNSKALENQAYTKSVYLPEGCDWYDFWTGERYSGGQCTETAAPLETIPVFVRAGSILPLAKEALSVEEQSGDITWRVYPGADGVFELYRDAGDGYGYERGEYTVNRLEWKDKEHKLFMDGEEIGYEINQ